MEAKEGRRARVEDIERRAGARVDLKQKGVTFAHHEIGGGEPLDLEGFGRAFDG